MSRSLGTKQGPSRRVILNFRVLLGAIIALGLPCALFAGDRAAVAAEPTVPHLDFIKINKGRREFIHSSTGKKFIPWGCNYDRDRNGRLLESYWKKEWPTVAQDFAEMKELGANTVRIHLQTARFVESPERMNEASLTLLAHLVNLAESDGLYLDITGLGCYEKQEVPTWYNDLGEKERWGVQERFWRAVARVCADSPAVFCYDLMNEPVLAPDPKGRDWTPGEFAGKYYVQRLTLDLAGRKPRAVGKAWVDKMTSAIHVEDKRHLITLGAIPWNLTFTNAKPDFYSREVSRNLDFVSVHFYPSHGKVKQALEALAAYSIGKPVVIEEMYPLNCSIPEMDDFITGSRKIATGWISFYWGETVDEYRRQKEKDPGNALMLEWLDYFKKKRP